MKKFFMIPVLALVMSMAFSAVSIPDANARDYRYDRHDRHDRHDRWDRGRNHRGNRGHGKVHKWSPPGHKVSAHARHRGHYKGYSKHKYHKKHGHYNKHRYHKRSRYIYDKYPRYNRHRDYRHGYGHKSESFSLNILLPVLDAFAGSSSYRY